ncbi:serine/threonine-protein kinase [Kitasatospora sp. NPDC096140]|uniref:serine/threonine-protein kinase n=1 Tax=Kitasatospora sp. NPDC096140 TaxID=3155425 RepID=UPI0033337E8D
MSRAVFGFPVLRAGDPGSFGDFRLVARLGEGGMGQVFLALSPGGQPAAVKVIRGEFAGDREFTLRFAREVAAAQKVRGAHLAPLLDADPEGEQPWLATGYVAGPSLRDLATSDGPLPTDQVLLLAWGIAQALADIHAAGVVHRDLKPGNIMLDESGPKVIDFGIVKSFTQSATYRSSSTRIGTPLYMSPEQALGRPVGPSSDVFALGSTLHFLATGREAFAAENEWAVAHRIVADNPDLAGLAQPLRRLIAACLHKDPEQRPTAERVWTWCETELGGTLSPGAWMGITGARDAIRQRTHALHALAARVAEAAGSGHPETHPHTVMDAASEKRPATLRPAPSGDVAGSATASGPRAAPKEADRRPAPVSAEIVVTKSQQDVKAAHDPGQARQAGLASIMMGALAVGSVLLGFAGNWAPGSDDPRPIGVTLGVICGLFSLFTGYISYLGRRPGPDVITTDANGFTIQRQPYWRLRKRTSFTIHWASVEEIEVVGGRPQKKNGALVRDKRGHLKEYGSKTELRVLFLRGHVSSKRVFDRGFPPTVRL